MESLFPLRNCVCKQQHLSNGRFIDVVTGKTLKPDSPVQPNEAGEIGRPIVILAPALYRPNLGQSALWLVKQVILIELFKPLGRRGANTGQPKQ